MYCCLYCFIWNIIEHVEAFLCQKKRLKQEKWPQRRKPQEHSWKNRVLVLDSREHDNINILSGIKEEQASALYLTIEDKGMHM